VQDVCARHGAQIPHINQKKNCFQSNAIGVALTCHYLESLIKIPIEPLDQHGIVVATTKDMVIDLEEVQCLAAYPKEFAVLIEDVGVAKSQKCNMIYIMADAYVVAFAFATGSIATNVHILQHAIR
jgi:hypothetical protein